MRRTVVISYCLNPEDWTVRVTESVRRVLTTNTKECDHLENLDLDGPMILKLILQKWADRLWFTGLYFVT